MGQKEGARSLTTGERQPSNEPAESSASSAVEGAGVMILWELPAAGLLPDACDTPLHMMSPRAKSAQCTVPSARASVQPAPTSTRSGPPAPAALMAARVNTLSALLTAR